MALPLPMHQSSCRVHEYVLVDTFWTAVASSQLGIALTWLFLRFTRRNVGVGSVTERDDLLQKISEIWARIGDKRALITYEYR